MITEKYKFLVFSNSSQFSYITFCNIRNISKILWNTQDVLTMNHYSTVIFQSGPLLKSKVSRQDLLLWLQNGSSPNSEPGSIASLLQQRLKVPWLQQSTWHLCKHFYKLKASYMSKVIWKPIIVLKELSLSIHPLELFFNCYYCFGITVKSYIIHQSRLSKHS